MCTPFPYRPARSPLFFYVFHVFVYCIILFIVHASHPIQILGFPASASLSSVLSLFRFAPAYPRSVSNTGGGGLISVRSVRSEPGSATPGHLLLGGQNGSHPGQPSPEKGERDPNPGTDAQYLPCGGPGPREHLPACDWEPSDAHVRTGAALFPLVVKLFSPGEIRRGVSGEKKIQPRNPSIAR